MNVSPPTKASTDSKGTTLPDLRWGRVALPAFPCQPPRPSARYEIPNDLILRSPTPATLGGVSQRLAAALDSVGYSERSYFSTCGGYAMATRLERTQPDGTPWSPDRWAEPSLQGRTVEHFSLADLLLALVSAPSGYYRVLVFMVTDQPITPAAAGMDARAAQDLLDRGATSLSGELAKLPYTRDHRVLAFVYEFVKPPASDAAAQSRPSDKDGRTHLERARILRALGASE